MSNEPFIPPPPLRVAKGATLIGLDLIDVGDRRREVTEAAVAMMADSIEAKGLISAILVRPSADDRYRLVIGGHRLAAARLLGWEQIRCEVRELDDDEALDLELTENLKRHELDKLDFGLFCAESVALDERRAQRADHGGDRRSAAARSSRQVGDLKNTRLTAELAERIGRGERTVQRAIATAKALDPETIALVRGTPIADNESKLVALGRERNAIKQRNLAQAMLDGARTVQAAKVAIGDAEAPVPNPDMDNLAALHVAWGRSSLLTRKMFLDEIDAVFRSAAAEQAAPANKRRGVAKKGDRP